MSNPFGNQNRKNQKPSKPALSINKRYCAGIDDLLNDDNNKNKAPSKISTKIPPKITTNQNINNNLLFENDSQDIKKEETISNIFEIENTTKIENEEDKKISNQQINDIFSGNEIKEEKTEIINNNDNHINIKNDNNKDNIIQDEQNENGETFSKTLFKKEEKTESHLLFNGNEITNEDNKLIDKSIDNNDNNNSTSSNKENFSFPIHSKNEQNNSLSNIRTDPNGYEAQPTQLNNEIQLFEEKQKTVEEINQLKNEISSLKNELNIANIKIATVEHEVQLYMNNVSSQTEIINQYKMKEINEDYYLKEIELLKKEIQEKNNHISLLEDNNVKLNNTINEQSEIIKELIIKEVEAEVKVEEEQKDIKIEETIPPTNENKTNDIFTEEKIISNPFNQETQIVIENNTPKNESTSNIIENNTESEKVLYGIRPITTDLPLLISKKVIPPSTDTNELIINTQTNTNKNTEKDNKIQTTLLPKQNTPFDFNNVFEEDDVDSLFTSIHQSSNNNQPKQNSNLFD